VGGSERAASRIAFVFIPHRREEHAMDSELSSYEVALRDLEAERDELDILIEAMKRRIARAGGTVSTVKSANHALADDTFFGMTVADAAAKYLGIVKQTKTTQEVGEALVNGGLKHSSADFSKTIRGTLGMREEFLRVNDKWGLTSWYPGAKRGKRSEPEESNNKKVARKVRKRKPEKNTTELLIEYLNSHAGQSFSPEVLAEKIGVKNINSLRSLLSQMVKTDRISKGEPSGYRAFSKA
jgi:hypothetical protein